MYNTEMLNSLKALIQRTNDLSFFFTALMFKNVFIFHS